MRSLGNDRGFTLCEILVAMIVFVIGALGTTALTLSIQRNNAFSKEIATATTLAQDRLEDIQNAGFAAAVNLTEDFGSLTNYGPSHTNYSSYKRITTVATVTASIPGPPPITEKPVKTVTVTVSWKRSPRSVTLSTMLAQ